MGLTSEDKECVVGRVFSFWNRREKERPKALDSKFF
jgi:hypothetical protein